MQSFLEPFTTWPVREKNALAAFSVSGLFIFYVVCVARGRIDIASLLLILVYALYSSGLYRHWKALACVVAIYTALSVALPLSDLNAGKIDGNLVESTAQDLAKSSIVTRQENQA